jgi:hypothetical protein
VQPRGRRPIEAHQQGNHARGDHCGGGEPSAPSQTAARPRTLAGPALKFAEVVRLFRCLGQLAQQPRERSPSI